MALTPEQRKYVVRSVLRILRDVNRDEILAALKEDVLLTESDEDGEQEELELDMVVLAVAEACRERLRLRQQSKSEPSET